MSFDCIECCDKMSDIFYPCFECDTLRFDLHPSLFENIGHIQYTRMEWLESINSLESISHSYHLLFISFDSTHQISIFLDIIHTIEDCIYSIIALSEYIFDKICFSRWLLQLLDPSSMIGEIRRDSSHITLECCRSQCLDSLRNCWISENIIIKIK